MGFRKLHDFNLALLGKQTWRLLNNENSLAFKVFKARYFPKCSILDAKLGNNPSFIWRSLLATQDLIRKGTRWRIGTGEKTHVLEDAWLQDSVHPFITTQHPALQNQMVKCLMKTGLREWDTEVIDDLFNERDQLLILGTPLSHNQEEDIRYWYKEDSGAFIVKSAFKLVQELKGSWVSNANSGFWRCLWNLKIAPKMLNFLWRACNEYLPTRVALISKHVPISQLCPLCNRFLETTLHCLVTCSFSQACLQSSGILNATHSSASYSSFAEWLESVMCQHANLTLSRVAMILWSIWKARNLVVQHNTYQHVDEVVRTAQFTLDH